MIHRMKTHGEQANVICGFRSYGSGASHGGCGGDNWKGHGRGGSGMLVILCVLARMLLPRVCSSYESSLSCTRRCIFLCMLCFNKKLNYKGSPRRNRLHSSLFSANPGLQPASVVVPPRPLALAFEKLCQASPI